MDHPTPLRRFHNGFVLDNAMDHILHACGVMGTLLMVPALIVFTSAVVTGRDLGTAQNASVEVRN